MEWLLDADTKLLLLINGWHHPWTDMVMLFVSGRFSWIPLYAILAYFIVRRYGWDTIRILLFIAVLISLSDQLSVHMFKLVFQRLRPCHEPDLRPLLHLVNGRCGGKFGFVSSHAANSFALITFIIFLFYRQWKPIIPVSLTWAALVNYSRIYMGVHYPSDSLAGAILGILCGLLVWGLYKAWDKWICRQNC
ncbi:MAG: phosphatase PAP2 family protein [Bacteroidales bacterium]|jgi:undecaprenyl-diphosphatase|nr:phosphatase PAP2 family protein [Bacteroidales bacterium]MDD3701735.1 phosphatase PAP2 family protein [Bacteroidales bacterium]MDY0370101.1 phosphatase PAP2 family protein [Bacteroidales bacterium]